VADSTLAMCATHWLGVGVCLVGSRFVKTLAVRSRTHRQGTPCNLSEEKCPVKLSVRSIPAERASTVSTCRCLCGASWHHRVTLV
jgi:hypothetical protein